MKIRNELISYITPEKGQSVLEVAKEIVVSMSKGEIGDEIFLNLPEGKTISLTGQTIAEIRDSILTQYIYTKF